MAFEPSGWVTGWRRLARTAAAGLYELRGCLGSLVLAAALYGPISGCGGGGGSAGGGFGGAGATGTYPRSIPCGYFGVVDGQPQATAGVTLTWVMDNSLWGDAAAQQWMEGKQVQWLQEARAQGATHAWLAVGYLVFDAHYRYQGTAALAAFEQQLSALGNTIPTIDAFSIVDEPDVNGVSDAAMLEAEHGVQAVIPGAKIAVVYGTARYPGIGGATYVSRDDYGVGQGVLQELPPLAFGQSWFLVIGAANPYRQDPQPFLDFAESHNSVSAVILFTYQDYRDPQGKMQHGVGTNGLLAQYQAACARIK